ncbi:Betaine--homocysteine S-methyltransferase 1 [Holothuria leucospilota]|uniref:Betaine--homocysteine S-methyltransferase 1 n=1 Tax=Holothuria leucospilota TaxID=206669 RepID=A0A9Q1BFZ4_HOLLE|nr:Betaine--homocysteine S-methyltransferase 1 [Holothuria leucospilota]
MAPRLQKIHFPDPQRHTMKGYFTQSIGLLERLNKGEKVVVAEGYLYNFEKRCYLKAGPYVPTVVLEHPDLVKQLHDEFVRAGSDVVLAFTYYGNRQKMNLIDRAHDLEELNRSALRITRKCADETGTLMAGNICNTNAYNPADPNNRENLKGMFKQLPQKHSNKSSKLFTNSQGGLISPSCSLLYPIGSSNGEWEGAGRSRFNGPLEEGADFIVAETFTVFDEAMIALESIKECSKGLPCVVTLAIMHNPAEDGEERTVDSVKVTEAMKRLEASGADVIGLNCMRGPETTIGLMEKIKKSGVKAHLDAVPVPYRTNEKAPIFMLLKDPKTGKRAFPYNMDCFMSTRDDIFEFGRRCDEIGISYIGVCCGNSPHYTRTLCESIGRTPPASKYSPDMNFHCVFGDEDHTDKYRKEQGEKLQGHKA